jgi:ankyrin repeat protein
VADDTETLRASRKGSRYGDGDTVTISGRTENTILEDQEATIPLVDRNPFRVSSLQIDLQVKRQNTNPFLNRSASAATSRGTTTHTSDISSIFESQADSGFHDSGFYDQDADMVQSSYRERMAELKAEAPPSLHRSVSEPSRKETPTPKASKVQLSPMERFHTERHFQSPIDYNPIESHLVRPMRQHTVSDSKLDHLETTKSAEQPKRSPWGTIKRLTSRKQLQSQPETGVQPGSINLKAARSVRRKGESNVHQSIDFGSEDGLQAPMIVRAAQSASRVEVAQLVEQRVDIEAVHSSSGRTALAVASHCGNDDVVAILLHHGANTEARDLDGMTPLHLAASRGHYRVVQYLLQSHANVDAQESRNSRTPLRLASDGGHLDCCQLLLEYRAKVSARDKEFSTALHAAARIGDVEIVELLIKNGADFEAKDAKLMTAMHYAAHGDYDSVVDKLIFYKANIESSGERGMSPLSCACASGATQAARLLISKKANIRHAADNGMNPLHFAAMHDHVDTADLLLQQKRVSVDPRNGDQMTPLHMAVAGNKFSTTELLLRKAASIEAACKRSLRPLHYACERGNETIVKLLLGYGAQVEATTTLGWRAVHFAAYKGSVEVMQALIQRHAQVEVRVPEADRALCMACSYGHLGLVRLLLDSGSAMRMRVAKGPSLEDNPLCRATRHGHLPVVNELLARGASVLERDESNWPPLRYAVHYGWSSIVSVLLDSGAPPSDEAVGSVANSSPASSKWGFADNVNMAAREQIGQLLKEAESSIMPRRMNEDDSFLMAAPAGVTLNRAVVAPTMAMPAATDPIDVPRIFFELDG